MMVTFGEIIKDFSHLRFVYDSLAFSTSLGRERLLSTPLATCCNSVYSEYDKIEELLPKELSRIKIILSHFRDIRGTIERLKCGATLTEVELFEIKHLAYYVNRLSLEGYIESLIEPYSILDPDNSGVVNFYIYNSYSPTLSALRDRLDSGDSDEIYLLIAEEEQSVRAMLSDKLRVFYQMLSHSIERIAEIDLLVAKCDLIKLWGLTKPSISESGSTEYKELFNPYLKSLINDYQTINITITPSPTLITGANMSGKSMLLKSVATAQYLVQFGFFIPASGGTVAIVDKIFLLSGDHAEEREGLSSYAAEITMVSDIIDSVEQGGSHLVLIDELARTTSPREGVAIVDATIALLEESRTMSLITTHYNSRRDNVRMLRVRGFVEGRINETITKGNISKFIDYSLYECDSSEERSSEAIRIAEILNVNSRLINKTKEEILCTKQVN